MEIDVKALLLMGLLFLAGCGSDIPMGGETMEGERFVGSLATRGRDYGPLELRNGSGVECNGTWQLDSQRSGSATFTCSDGRSGTAELAAGETSGTMKGMLGGKPFAATFERSPL